jgi:hypothetical protein
MKVIHKGKMPGHTGRHGGSMGDETAEFYAVAEQEGISPVKLRTVIDQAKTANGEVTKHKTTARAKKPPRPAAAAPNAAVPPAWPTAKWKDAPEKIRGKKGGIITFLKREWEPFIQNTGEVVTRDVLAAHDREAEAALTRYVENHAMPKGISILFLREKDLDEVKRMRSVLFALSL